MPGLLLELGEQLCLAALSGLMNEGSARSRFPTLGLHLINCSHFRRAAHDISDSREKSLGVRLHPLSVVPSVVFKVRRTLHRKVRPKVSSYLVESLCYLGIFIRAQAALV